MNPMSINQLLAASGKVLENANELVQEADLLLSNNRFARTFTLAHLACEEIAKFSLFYTLAIEIARGHDINWKTIGQQLHHHQIKIRQSILLDFLRKSVNFGIPRAESVQFSGCFSLSFSPPPML